MAIRKAVLVYKKCGTCQALKQAGMCRDTTCIEVTTPLGKAIAHRGRITKAPQCVIVNTKNGKVTRCNTKPYIDKYLPRRT